MLGPKLLDLDLMNGITSEEGDSELSLKVDLQHFGEVCNILLSLQEKIGFGFLSSIQENPFIWHPCV